MYFVVIRKTKKKIEMKKVNEDPDQKGLGLHLQ